LKQILTKLILGVACLSSLAAYAMDQQQPSISDQNQMIQKQLSRFGKIDTNLNALVEYLEAFKQNPGFKSTTQKKGRNEVSYFFNESAFQEEVGLLIGKLTDPKEGLL
jgi:hypothetical protein